MDKYRLMDDVKYIWTVMGRYSGDHDSQPGSWEILYKGPDETDAITAAKEELKYESREVRIDLAAFTITATRQR
jgi:hypothetical protein